MPLDLGTSAIINAGANLASTGINALTQVSQNKANRKWAEQQYQRQLDDNQKQWHQQNEYNSPLSQMQRLQEAGLNPNLVYGNGTSTTAGAMAAAPSASYKGEAPKVDLGSSFMAYQNTRMQSAQYDNLKAQNTVLLEEAALKKATVDNMNTRTALDSLNLSTRPELNQIGLQAAQQGLRKLTADSDISEITATNLGQKYGNDFRESTQRILNMQEQNANTQAERDRIKAATQDIMNSNKLKELEIDLRRQGVTSSDQLYWRVIARFLKSFGISFTGQ